MKIMSADKAKKICNLKKNKREEALKKIVLKNKKRSIKRGIEILNEAINDGRSWIDMNGPKDFIEELAEMLKSQGYCVEIKDTLNSCELKVSWA